jgi:hypothetical protein
MAATFILPTSPEVPVTTAHARSRLVAAAARLLVLAALPAAPLHAQQPLPRPFDPLTPTETAAAEQLARADSGIARMLAGRTADVAQMNLFVPKPPDDGRPLLAHIDGMTRHADLVFSTLDTPHFGVWARVDLGARRVLEARRIEDETERGSFQVPFAPRELERAGELVRASAEGRRRPGDPPQGWMLEYLALGPGELGAPCFRDRCVMVLFRRERTYHRAYALVNLETGAVEFREGEDR